MKKKLVTFLTAILVIASFCVMPAAANNCADTAFEFDFVNNQEQDTGFRQKTDTTSAYMSCSDSSGQSYYAWVYGGLKSEGSVVYSWNASINPSNTLDDRRCTFEGGSTQKIINWVKEKANANGWSTVYAKIHGEKCIPSRTFFANGVWSPDSV